jgi:hypothetical protein
MHVCGGSWKENERTMLINTVSEGNILKIFMHVFLILIFSNMQIGNQIILKQ